MQRPSSWFRALQSGLSAVLALCLPGCGSDDGANGPSAVSSECTTLCRRIAECDPTTIDGCAAECARSTSQASRVLQPIALESYQTCMNGVLAELDQIACADLETRLDCFSNAVTLPGRTDPGWAAYAGTNCAGHACDQTQLGECTEFVVGIGQSVPCLNATGLDEAVSCTVSCSPGAYEFECTTPG
jgi:hypothetical protein